MIYTKENRVVSPEELSSLVSTWALDGSELIERQRDSQGRIVTVVHVDHRSQLLTTYTTLDTSSASPAPGSDEVGETRNLFGELVGNILAVAPQPEPLLACIHFTGGRVSLWEAATGVYRAELPSPGEYFEGYTAAAWSPNGRFLATGTVVGTVFVWDIEAEKVVLVYRGHYGTVNALSWSSCGDRIASASSDGTVRAWMADTGRDCFRAWYHREAALDVAWAPSGAQIASGWSNGVVRIWNAANGRPLQSFRGHRGAVRSVAYAPDGASVASAAGGGSVQVWRIAVGWSTWRQFLGTSWTRVTSLPRRAEGSFKQVAWSPDGQFLATLNGSGALGLQIWETATFHPITSHQDPFLQHFAWIPGERSLVFACSSRVSRWWLAS